MDIYSGRSATDIRKRNCRFYDAGVLFQMRAAARSVITPDLDCGIIMVINAALVPDSLIKILRG